MPSILLKNSTTLLHDINDVVKCVVTDILIENDNISRIAPDISAPDAETIDCSDKIVSPGFVDTHHHIWQTQLKGRHANETLFDYLATGNFMAKLYSPEDVFWGELAGCMEMIQGGTTTVVDHCQAAYSHDHARKAIAATVSSGIRSVFCYAAAPRLKSTRPFEVNPSSPLSNETLQSFEDIARQGPYGDGRVTVGFAYDVFRYTPKEVLESLMEKLDELRVEVVTVHHTFWDLGGKRPTGLEELEQRGILDNRFLFSHAGNTSQVDVDVMKRHGCHVSSTPSTEMQMSMGLPVTAFRPDVEVQQLCSLGVDCHSNNSAYIPDEARIGLQGARAARSQPWLQKGKIVSQVGPTVEEAFNLATILGARAAKMGDKVGSIKEGKLADLVLFDKFSPAMIAASQQSPIAAIMIHSSPADVDTVIIGGKIRKRSGHMLPVMVDEEGRVVAERDILTWADVAKEVVISREVIQRQMEEIDFVDGAERAKDMFHFDESVFVHTS